MIVHTIFALIHDSEVKNVVVGEYYDCNIAAMQAYGNDAFAIEVTQIPVQINDRYQNGIFLRYNPVTAQMDVIEPIPTVEEDVTVLKAKNEVTDNSLVDIQLALTELYELMLDTEAEE